MNAAPVQIQELNLICLLFDKKKKHKTPISNKINKKVKVGTNKNLKKREKIPRIFRIRAN